MNAIYKMSSYAVKPVQKAANNSAFWAVGNSVGAVTSAISPDIVTSIGSLGRPGSGLAKTAWKVVNFITEPFHTMDLSFNNRFLTDMYMNAIPVNIANMATSCFGVGAVENLCGAFTKSGRGPIMGTLGMMGKTLTRGFSKTPVQQEALESTLRHYNRAA